MKPNADILAYLIYLVCLLLAGATIVSFWCNTKTKEKISEIIKQIKLDDLEKEFTTFCATNTNLNNYFIYKIYVTKHRLKFTERFVTIFSYPSLISSLVAVFMFQVNHTKEDVIMMWMLMNFSVVFVFLGVQGYLLHKYNDLLRRLR